MGKIIDRVRLRQRAIQEKEMARRSDEIDLAFIQSLHAAYGGTGHVVGPLIFIAVIVGLLGLASYEIFWR